MKVTFQKVSNGLFTVLLNGEDTGYEIINGSLGLTGRDTPNMYGIAKDGSNPKWIGSLTNTKKMVTYWLTK